MPSPITYDTDLCFATRDEVMAAAGDLNLVDADAGPPAVAGTKPSDSTGEDFCKKVSALVVAATEMAGTRYIPSDTIEPFLRSVLNDVTAIGTAFRIRWSIYTRTRSKADADACDKLLAQWEVFMGEGTAEGGTLRPGAGGTLGGIIRGTGAGADAKLLVSDVTKGYTSLASNRARGVVDVTPPFEVRKVD